VDIGLLKEEVKNIRGTIMALFESIEEL